MAQYEQQIMTKLKVNHLPSLPHVLVDMLQACQGNKASFQQMSTIISRDTAISARVISLANSSFYNCGTQVSSIERALLVLGIDTIKTIVITASVQQFFSGFNIAHTNFLKQFWKRSLSCALISKSLAILTSYPNPDEAYLTGLLHNIGELVLETNYPDQFSQLIQENISESDRVKKEQELFSVDHAGVGAWLAKEWNLGDFTSDAVNFHHSPAESIQDAHHLVKLIYLASHLSDDEHSATDHETDIAQLLFELNASLVNEIIVKIKSEVIDVASSLGIDINNQEQTSADQNHQVSLARHVRNIGLLQTAAGEVNRANSKIELGRAFQCALELLFSYTNSAVFWYQSRNDELSFITPDHPESVPIKFKLENSKSLIAQAARERRILCTLENNSAQEHLPVVDQQIIRLVKGEGLICLPVQTSEQLFCVLVAGCRHPVAKDSTQAHLLEYFTNEIALTCAETLTHIQANENKVSRDEINQRANEIAHEANNPLNIINNYLVSLASRFSDRSDIQEELDILKEEVARTSHILLRLKDIESETNDTQSGVDINKEINNLVSLYKSSIFLINSIECNLELDSELAHNPANRNSFKQILTNLIKNAAEAMPDGGKITISTTASVNLNGKDFVEILIKDTGPGIPQEIKNNLYTPVISSKGKGHSGLGLSITKNLVTEAKGSISCRSSEKGTVFQILLPRA